MDETSTCMLAVDDFFVMLLGLNESRGFYEKPIAPMTSTERIPRSGMHSAARAG
jgi:hypothetical protein